VTTMGKVNLDDLAASIVGCFPTLDLLEQRLSLELYRLLAASQPVPRETLAERLPSEPAGRPYLTVIAYDLETFPDVEDHV
jgi:hypothetical protein